MQVNVKGTMLCCKYSIPYMKAQGGGAIVNISTIAAVVGMQGYGGMAAYAASKAGLHGLTRAMAADYAADGIRVNGIIVGTVWTARLAARASDGDIIVMHDGDHKNPRADRRQTVAAAEQLIPLLRARGFRFGNLCQAVGNHLRRAATNDRIPIAR